jgi:SAM-dependent methyltransferase
MKKGLKMASVTFEQSIDHSANTLDTLNQFSNFMNCIKTVADMGCGSGDDAYWWAQLVNENGDPRNINVFGIDKQFEPARTKFHDNITYIQADFTSSGLAKDSVDFLWAHNSLQYSLSPLQTLLHWWDIMKPEAMLLVSIPYNFEIRTTHERSSVDVFYGHNSYFNFGMGNLIMSLALTGFDCRNSHFKMDKENNWIQAAVYKLPKQPNPNRSWYDLVEENLLPMDIHDAINQNGNFRDSDISCEWIDRSQYFLGL